MLFDYSSRVCREKLMIPWLQCAYTRRCMMPIGVILDDHSPEQSVFSILATQNGLVSSCNKTRRITAVYWTDRSIHNLNNGYLEKEIIYMSNALGKFLSINSTFIPCL